MEFTSRFHSAGHQKNVKENAQTKSVEKQENLLGVLCCLPPADPAACRMQQIVSIN